MHAWDSTNCKPDLCIYLYNHYIQIANYEKVAVHYSVIYLICLGLIYV